MNYKITYRKNNKLDVYRTLKNRIVICGPYYLAYAKYVLAYRRLPKLV